MHWPKSLVTSIKDILYSFLVLIKCFGYNLMELLFICSKICTKYDTRLKNAEGKRLVTTVLILTEVVTFTDSYDRKREANASWTSFILIIHNTIPITASNYRST